MKKILLLLLIAPVLGFGQVLTDVFYVWQDMNSNHTKGSHYSYDNKEDFRDYFLKVPDGKMWKIMEVNSFGQQVYSGTKVDEIYFNQFNSSNQTTATELATIFLYDETVVGSIPYTWYKMNSATGQRVLPYLFIELGETLIPSGTEFFLKMNNSNEGYEKLLIYEYSFDNNSLSSNYPENIKNNSNTPVLFPNPTSSLLALNSDKEYDIEVYDMAGNKVMALTENTIDMSHLSSATYIVKALDKVENEEVSYKVVKN